MIMNNKRYVIDDYSSYESEKCSNGGCYGFSKLYYPQADGSYLIQHHTTADFEYCCNCGTFGNSREHEDCVPEVVTSIPTPESHESGYWQMLVKYEGALPTLNGMCWVNDPDEPVIEAVVEPEEILRSKGITIN